MHRQAGHDVRAVAEDFAGKEDVLVLATARRERRVLLTNDKDFAELVFRRRMSSFGILLLRLRDWSAEHKTLRLIEVLRGEPELHRALLAVTPRSVRRRDLRDLG